MEKDDVVEFAPGSIFAVEPFAPRPSRPAPSADTHLEVRCCCRPENLLGWLPRTGSGSARTFAIGTSTRVTLPIGMYYAGGEFSSEYPAFKSDDTPIEILRLIPGFIEND